jgi:hypothetical protein
VFGRVIQAVLKSRRLLGFGYVKIELDDRRSLFGKHSFEVIDLLVAPLPDFLRNQIPYAAMNTLMWGGATRLILDNVARIAPALASRR